MKQESPGRTLQPGPFDEETIPADGRVITAEDRKLIVKGTRILLLVAAINYEDSNGVYELHLCRYLKTPVMELKSFGVCGWYDETKKLQPK
jgi:hypothetical protein